jgi:hypothetical protein
MATLHFSSNYKHLDRLYDERDAEIARVKEIERVRIEEERIRIETERIRIEEESPEHLARVANCSITKGYFSGASRRARRSRAATKTDR